MSSLRVAVALGLMVSAFGCRGRRLAGGMGKRGRGRGDHHTGEAGRSRGLDAGPPPKFERHVVRQPPLPPQANVAQIFIGFDKTSAPWNPPRAKQRSKEEARALAQKLAAEARSGADFGVLAKRESDWPLAIQNGGALGVVRQGEAGMLQMMDDKVFAMKVGEVADPYESGLGFHVVKRLPMLHLAHVFVAVRDGRDGWPPRTQDEAKALAARVERDLQDGKSFDDEAFAVSDDLLTAGRGGDLGGQDERSRMNPAVRKAAQALKVGEVSAPIETPAGFEILKRLE